MLLASVLGHRFSVLQTTAHSVPMKRELVKKYGFGERCASVVAVDENSSASMEDKLYEAGKIAISRDGAEVLALGCAGLAGLDARLRDRLEAPVVDGVAASVKIAEAVISSGNRTSKKGLYAPHV
jgi:allantoin racemase